MPRVHEPGHGFEARRSFLEAFGPAAFQRAAPTLTYLIEGNIVYRSAGRIQPIATGS